MIFQNLSIMLECSIKVYSNVHTCTTIYKLLCTTHIALTVIWKHAQVLIYCQGYLCLCTCAAIQKCRIAYDGHCKAVIE